LNRSVLARRPAGRGVDGRSETVVLSLLVN
jgi:hypothetical protein